jgi:hypothetical protein
MSWAMCQMQWMLMNRFEATGDEAIRGEQINACLKGLPRHIRAPQNAEEQMTANASAPQQVSITPATFDEAAAVIKARGEPTKDHPQELNAGAGSEGRALVYRRTQPRCECPATVLCSRCAEMLTDAIADVNSRVHLPR